MNSKKPFATALLFLLLCFGLDLSAHAKTDMSLYDLKVEHLHEPIQLDTEQPRLSWKIRTSDASVKGLHQQAFRILVASTPELLANDQSDLWDSGQVTSTQSILIPYQGKKLESHQACFWKVRVTDSRGQTSDWSDIAKWEMALLSPKEWTASQWIGSKQEESDHELSERQHEKLNKKLKAHLSPLLRKEIFIKQPVRRARAYVSGIGYSEFYLNGNKISDHVLNPGQTNYEKHTLYVVHDLTEELTSGKNALGLWLGNGFYGQNLGFDAKFGYGRPKVRAKLLVEYLDGTSEEFVTDTSWKTHASPIVFDNVYWGETYDARLEIPGWSKVGFDDSAWKAAIELPAPCSDSQLRPQLLPPMKVVERLVPVSTRQVAPGTYLFDFGKNIAGWVNLRLNQNAGDVIKVFPTEVLTKDNQRADQVTYGGAPGSPHEHYYLCKGDGTESWSPRFSYGGFQYVEVSGLTKAPSEGEVEAHFVRSDVKKQGSFTSSNELLNQQYEASLLSLEGNWHSLPEDCPHREKCGWLGDAHATAGLSLYNYEMSRFFSKYVRDIEDSLRIDGRFKRVAPNGAGVPTMVAPGKRANRIANIDWGVAYLILPWQMYLHTGDAEAFKPHFENMKNAIAYYKTFKNEAGVIDNGLGDWCPPRWDRRQAPEYMECHPFVSGTAFYYQALQIASQMANKLGDTEYSEWCLAEAKAIKQAFNKVYLQPIEGSELKHYGSQTATVMALKLGMVPHAEVEARLAGLLYDINELHDGHHACGIHGLRHLYTVLADLGQSDQAYEMLTDTSFPSPGYVLSCGLTTWPERRFEWKKRRFSNSFNHPMNGGFTAFMHESLGGIRPNAAKPGYKHFTLKPQLTDQIEWVKTKVESPYGPIRSEWKNQGETFSWEVEVPVNTTATLSIPYTPGEVVMVNDQPLESKASSKSKSGPSYLEHEVGAGVYQLRVE